MLSGLVAWFRADLGVTYVQGPVTAAGTTPPAVTLTGTPVAPATSLEIDITLTGARGTATFTWKLNGAIQQTLQLTAATFVLGSTGITANFPVGTYTNDNVYTSVVTVSSWADQSGNSATGTQATAAAQPNFSATGWANGKPALQWTGANGVYLLTPPTVTLGAFSAFIIAATSVVGSLYGHGVGTTNGGVTGGRALGSSGAAWMYVDGAVKLSGSAYHFTNGSQNVSATGSHFTTECVAGQHIISSNQLASGVPNIIQSITNDTALVLVSNFTGTTTTTATAAVEDSTATSIKSILTPNSITWTSDSAPHCLVQRYNGTQASSLLAVDGVDQTPYTVLNAGGTGTLPLTDVVYLGNAGGGVTSQPTGLIAEIALYNRSLLDSEAALLHEYARAFWGTP